MSITNGPNLGLLLNANTGEAHDAALRALLRGIDTLVMAVVKGVGTNTPPATPANGDAYVIGTGTGLWAGKNNQLTVWDGTAWVFYVPKAGWTVVDAMTTGNPAWTYTGSAWSSSLTVTGNASIAGSLGFGGYFGPSSASFWKQATYGLAIAGTTGASYDLALLTPGAGVIAYNPTGTLNMMFNGGVNKFGSGAGSSVLGVNGGAGNDRQLLFQSNGSTRWRLQAESSTESGSNAGSIFNLVAHDDSGVTIDVVLSVSRAVGTPITFSSGRTVNMKAVNFGGSDFKDFLVGTWTPTAVSLGGTGVSYNAKYTRVGNRVDFNLTITGTGLTATGNTTNITLPFTPVVQGACSVTDTSVNHYGPGLIYTDGRVYLPTIASTPNILVTGTLFLA